MPAVLPRYTVDMLDELPDDPHVRYELIDGFLLVTPAAGQIHSVLTTRLVVALAGHLPETFAHVLPPGEVQVGKYHRLIPDILVTPSRFPLDAAWTSITDWLLAIEIVSRSSAIYDREHKRWAYLALGVREYWVVDHRTRTVEVWHAGDAAAAIHRDTVTYRTPGGEYEVPVDIEVLFRDFPSFEDE
ncbi:MAG: Uma2 family endonuclease [Gemmatimonadaceae bacterium]